VSSIFPPLSRIAAAGLTVLPTEKFIKAVEISLRSFAVGMVAALIVGIGLGVLMARVESIGRILGTWVNVFVSARSPRSSPSSWRCWESERRPWSPRLPVRRLRHHPRHPVGIRKADRSLIEMARSFGATGYQIYTKVLILSALPEILAGIRLAAIRGVKGVVIGQLLVSIIAWGSCSSCTPSIS